MLKKIYQELILIRKELQELRRNSEFNAFIPKDSDGTKYSCLSSSTVPDSANQLQNL